MYCRAWWGDWSFLALSGGYGVDRSAVPADRQLSLVVWTLKGMARCPNDVWRSILYFPAGVLLLKSDESPF